MNYLQTKAIPRPWWLQSSEGDFWGSWSSLSSLMAEGTCQEGLSKAGPRGADFRTLMMFIGWLVVLVCQDCLCGYTASPVFWETPDHRMNLESWLPDCFFVKLLFKMTLAAWWSFCVWDTDILPLANKRGGGLEPFFSLGFRKQQTLQACCCNFSHLLAN